MILHLFIKKTDETHYLLDNKGLNKQQLLNLGVLEENIQVSSYCTNENNDLFFFTSNNHDGQRNVTIIKKKIGDMKFISSMILRFEKYSSTSFLSISCQF